MILQDEEVEGASGGEYRDSDVEFEQMLADAEEPTGEEGSKGTEEAAAEPPTDPPVRRKAKTKIGNKSKKKKKTKTTSKFPDGEESLQVELSCLWLVRSLLFQTRAWNQ